MKFLHSPFNFTWTELFKPFRVYVGPQTPPPPSVFENHLPDRIDETWDMPNPIQCKLDSTKKYFFMLVAFADDSNFFFFCSGSDTL